MKKKTSVIIGLVLLAAAVGFVVYSLNNPQGSFPWSNKVTFMLYGAYIWLLFKFFIDIPFLAGKTDNKTSIAKALLYVFTAIVFLLTETIYGKTDIYTVMRGFIVVCALDLFAENIYFGIKSRQIKK